MITPEEELLIAEWQIGENNYLDEPPHRVVTAAEEWGMLMDMCDPALGEHQFDEAYFMLKDTITAFQEGKQKILAHMEKEGTYESITENGILNDLQVDLRNYERNIALQKIESLLRKNLRFKQRFEGLQNQEEINQQHIDQAKRYPLEEIVGETKRDGARRKARCPLHGEKTASFVIYPNNTWYCFGCHRGGDSIDLVMELEGITFPKAVQQLQ